MPRHTNLFDIEIADPQEALEAFNKASVGEGVTWQLEQRWFVDGPYGSGHQALAIASAGQMENCLAFIDNAMRILSPGVCPTMQWEGGAAFPGSPDFGKGRVFIEASDVDVASLTKLDGLF